MGSYFEEEKSLISRGFIFIEVWNEKKILRIWGVERGLFLVVWGRGVCVVCNEIWKVGYVVIV